LKELGGLYLQRTREELALLRAQLPQAHLGHSAALLEVQHYAHRISGSGAMLGFKAISEAMSQVERILRRAEPVPSESEWQVIQEQLLRVDAELARTPPATNSQQ
jgi:HPt (histidine-containing phosphotransfer) domain-containing protein